MAVKGDRGYSWRKRHYIMNTITQTNDMGRMNPDDINPALCQARNCHDDDVIPGYKPKVFNESQCQQQKQVGDLCTSCNAARNKAEELGDDYQCYKKGHGKGGIGLGRWFGLITEDPHPTCHMLGTAWANNKVKKVDVEAETDSEVESGSDSEDVNTTLKRLREKTVGIIHMEIRPTTAGEYIIVKRRIIEEAWIIDNAAYPDKDVAVRKLGIINEGVITPA